MAKKFDFVVTRVNSLGVPVNNRCYFASLAGARRWMKNHSACVDAAGVYYEDRSRQVSYRIYKYDSIHGFLCCIYIN